MLLPMSTVLAQNWYLSGHGGYSLFGGEVEDSATTSQRELEADEGINLGGAIGYRLHVADLGNWRAELGYNYFSADLEDDSRTVLANAALTTHSFMLRGLYDFKLSSLPAWRPYLGLVLALCLPTLAQCNSPPGHDSPAMARSSRVSCQAAFHTNSTTQWNCSAMYVISLLTNSILAAQAQPLESAAARAKQTH
ncbi:MAG: hypothetical protein ACI8W7_001173 [Gammaproteobacteria bacterium]|jgi:hypothetical protein